MVSWVGAHKGSHKCFLLSWAFYLGQVTLFFLANTWIICIVVIFVCIWIVLKFI